ncbi:(2Fe-2S)-binding protein [Vibrio sp. SCSIO 43136]|uniref:(2Fe-2S)-binding protein n=1 Tax=Vibrio sp. SCSIO 43136 TaxID=2819101 RepID=UPI00207549B4|nr:(2Fe-2S)-binding protein [Vibrio sp. SCSIO 43136]USD65533.1 (2Fe-2S)-binding protein [Vibrio sp. SCSIO 43136]
MIVCVCHRVSDKLIRQMVTEKGFSSVRAIREVTPLGSQCGKCVPMAKAIINETNDKLSAQYQQAG